MHSLKASLSKQTAMSVIQNGLILHKTSFSTGRKSLQCDSLEGTHVERGQVSGGGGGGGCGSNLVVRPAPGAPKRATESPAKTSDSACAANSTKPTQSP